MTAPLPAPPPLLGVEWRPARRSDAPAIVALVDACFEMDGGYRVVVSELVDRWDADYSDIDLDSFIGVTADGEVITSIISEIPSIAETKWRAFGSSYVHPDHRTSEMLEFAHTWWEIRSLQRFAARDDGLDQLLCHDIYDWQTERIEFLVAHGYEPMRYFDELLRDLADPIEDRPLSDGLAVLSFWSAPLEDARIAHNEAFVDHWGSQPISEKSWVRADNEFLLQDASFVVYDDGRPVGYLLASAFPHDFDDRGHTEAWIEGLGTVRSHRKQGIGSALVTLSMREFASSGLEYAAIAVDSENPTGASELYADLGFVPDRRTIAYNKQVFADEGDDRDG